MSNSSQYDNNIRRTNQNIGILSRSVLLQANQNATLTLDCLNSIQQNYNDTQLTEQEHYIDTQKAVAKVKYKIDTQMEKTDADSKLNTLITANTVRNSLNDSTIIINKNIKDDKQQLNNDIYGLLSGLNATFTEGKKAIYEQSAQTRAQDRDAFGLLKTGIRNAIDDLEVNNNLNYTKVNNLIITNAKSDTIGTKDIQLLNLKNKNEQLLFANENASRTRLYTLENTEKLTHQIHNTKLQALKHKELLSQQILQKELDLVRNENNILSALKKQACEQKNALEERSKRTRYKLKNDEISRLKDELFNAQITLPLSQPYECAVIPEHKCPL